MTLVLVLALILVLLALATIWLLVYRETAADIPPAKPHHGMPLPVRKHRPHHS